MFRVWHSDHRTISWFGYRSLWSPVELGAPINYWPRHNVSWSFACWVCCASSLSSVAWRSIPKFKVKRKSEVREVGLLSYEIRNVYSQPVSGELIKMISCALGHRGPWINTAGLTTNTALSLVIKSTQSQPYKMLYTIHWYTGLRNLESVSMFFTKYFVLRYSTPKESISLRLHPLLMFLSY